MNYGQIRKIYEYVYSAPADSPERMSRLSGLSDSDSQDLFDFVVGLRDGRIKESDIDEIWKGDRQIMTYKEWKALNKSKWQVDIQRIMDFETMYPLDATEYKKRLSEEKRKRSEIMQIKDTKKRREMIAKHMDLFEY